MKKTKKELNDCGLRVTNQRTLILEAIRHSQGHVDAEEVYRKIQKRQPRISLSTVYRTLQRFKELGLIDELHFAEEHHHYELKPNAEHYHLVCRQCDKIIEFEYPLVNLLKQNVPEAQGFKITNSDITFMGYCPECQEKRNMTSGMTRRDSFVSIQE